MESITEMYTKYIFEPLFAEKDEDTKVIFTLLNLRTTLYYI